MEIAVVGAGVAGLVTAVTLAERGTAVTLHERAPALGAGAASWLAGGMLAPFCEAERADRAIVAPGLAAIDWWAERVPGTQRRGTLVVAQPRDAGELRRFAARTQSGARVAVRDVEPDLGERFAEGLHFIAEAHLDPRVALKALADRFVALGGRLALGSAVDPSRSAGEAVVDCRGQAGDAGGLRRVRGEMLLLHAPEVVLSRPVRLLHPRHSLYVVPRGQGLFMVGATETETRSAGGITARGAMELLASAYALDPRFGEAEIVETGAGLRPAFPDNLPRVSKEGRIVSLNGLYRHGFLLAPAFAAMAADLAIDIAGQQRSAA